MPLYQEPDVYIEEQPPAVTPIPAVATSITGFVGVAERGPLLPQLVTSPQAFRRIYGGWLDRATFTHAGRAHGFLPDAVTGFFLNGGQLLYVVRVVPPSALRAEFLLADTGQGLAGAATRLLFGVPQGSGTALNAPLAYVLAGNNLQTGDRVQVGAGSQVENLEIAGVLAFDTPILAMTGIGHLALASGLVRTVAAGVAVQEVARAADVVTFSNGSGGVFDLAADATAGATEIMLGTATDADGALVGNGVFLELGGDVQGAQIIEVADGQQVSPGLFRITLHDPLQADAVTAAGVITALDLSGLAGTPATVARDAGAGESLIAVSDLGVAPNLRTAAELVVFTDGATPVAVQRVAEIGLFRLDVPAYTDYDAGTRIALVSTVPLARLTLAGSSSNATSTTMPLDDTDGLFAGLPVIVFTGGADVAATITAVDEVLVQITVEPALPADPPAGDTVTPDYRLTADAPASGVLLALNARLGLDPPPGAGPQLLRIGTAPDEEYLAIAEIPGPRGVAPDAGVVVLDHPLSTGYPSGAAVRVMTAPVDDVAAGRARIALDAGAGDDELVGTGGAEFVTSAIVRVDTAGGVTAHHRLAQGFDTTVVPAQVTLVAATARAHPAGAGVAERAPLLRVVARDPGSAGNRLRVAAGLEPEGLLTGASVVAQPASDIIRLDIANGLHEGSVLEFVDPATGTAQGPPAWVASVDRVNGNLVQLGANLAPANLPLVGLAVRSVEYRITVFDTARLLPGIAPPANPVVDSEVYRHVSLHPLHPRYAETLIGGANAELDPLTGLPRGASRLVRVEDLAPTPADALAVRALALLTDTLPSGQIRAARFPLLGGTDDIHLVTDQLYQGTVSNDPEERTGIEALRNLTDISIIACPGQTTVPVQSRLIGQCEDLRSRFALLDPPEDATTFLAVRAHRQNYDSNYAAMNYPWFRIVNPAPGAIDRISAPPCGHIAGLYARTDLQRGVFKAPANEVVRGIDGIATRLTGPEHGLFNADNVQVNITRDLSDEGRGRRMMGARCISSDPANRYVNVRRTLIFLTVSMEQGLRTLIFEPNDQRLWGRVTRSITNFLTTQWRFGALFGATPEQAFFVRCDETTMTEDDILNGRLICLVGVAIVRPAEFIIIRLQEGLIGPNEQNV